MSFEKFGAPKEQKSEDEEREQFQFTAEDVLKTLRPEKGNKIEYIGTATSDFQSQPFIYGPDGKPIITSDWELELAKNIQGEPSKIVSSQRLEELPHFHEEKEAYIKRSKELGLNMFRFSLDFPRLCPEKGQFNEELMADYIKALALIRAHGQEPMLSIYHWPMPRYLIEADDKGNIKKGGWEHPDAAKHFRFYVESVFSFLADDDKVRTAFQEEKLNQEAQDKFLAEGLVRYFLSINEPISILASGYLGGAFPPFKRGRVLIAKEVLGKLVAAHDIARDEIKSGKFKGGVSREPKVGVAHAWNYFDGLLGDIGHEIINRYPADRFERNGAYTDFLGLQYYFRTTLPRFTKKGREYSEHPFFGDIYPPGVYEVLKKMNAAYPQKEIFLSEFGFSDAKDERRPYWILETTRYVLEALKQGIPVKGMLLWSLVNNFEWVQGMEQKFGLFSEPELKQPLKPSKKGEIRSWEAWRAVAKAIKNPSPETLKELQDYYETAKKQFEKHKQAK